MELSQFPFTPSLIKVGLEGKYWFPSEKLNFFYELMDS